MDADVLLVEADERGPGIRRGLRRRRWPRSTTADRERVAAVVATAGTTNVGVVDDLAGIGAVAAEHGAWFHVDAAYGGAALAVPSARPLFDGIEQADSFVVDPHKWLFAPFDCAALVYRDPAIARATHTQHAEYLDVVTDRPDWNPSDYAYHLSRRARGLPFWFSLATHGTAAYAEAIEAEHPPGRGVRRAHPRRRPRRAGPGAGAVDRRVPAARMVDATTTTPGATASSTKAWPSSCPPPGGGRRCCASAS